MKKLLFLSALCFCSFSFAMNKKNEAKASLKKFIKTGDQKALIPFHNHIVSRAQQSTRGMNFDDMDSNTPETNSGC